MNAFFEWTKGFPSCASSFNMQHVAMTASNLKMAWWTKIGFKSGKFVYTWFICDKKIFWDKHTSEMRGWCLMKWRSEMLQNLPYSEATLQKKEVFAQRNVPAKCFKICYILCIRKLMLFFSFFISCNFIFLPYECPGLCRHRPGHS